MTITHPWYIYNTRETKNVHITPSLFISLSVCFCRSFHANDASQCTQYDVIIK